MSVARCREITARLRAAGIVVHEWPGWEARGNGQAAAYEGAIVHHTATAFGNALPGTGVGNLLVHGRPDLAGPLCNYAGNVDGSLTCIAAHPANHAGASGGRSMGPLPTTSLFNKRVLGLEIVYPGTEPMRTAQYRAALAWSRIATDVCGYGDIQRARAHGETSITGKWDPGDAPGRTINMVAFRAATRVQPEDPTVKNLILGREKGGVRVWVGDGITRRHVQDETELIGLRDWIKRKGGDDTVYEGWADLRVLGVDVAAAVPVVVPPVDLAPVIAYLTEHPPVAGVSAEAIEAIAVAVVAEFKKEGN